MEKYVIDQIRAVGLGRAILAETFNAARQQSQTQLARIEEERVAVQHDYEVKTALLQHVASKSNPEVGLLADLHEQIRAGEQRLTAIREEAVRLKASVFTQ
jgi:SMC interacting uncharacterized protein involved in chromosome segregation